jgi:hypothetical protein
MWCSKRSLQHRLRWPRLLEISAMQEKEDMCKHPTCGQNKITRQVMLILRLVVDGVIHRDLRSGGYFYCVSKVLMQKESKECRGFLLSFN